MSDSDDLDEQVHRLHAALAATEERPVERSAGRWIGEAQAVAGDLAGGDPDPEVVSERVGHVRDLLSNVEGTGDSEADERVAEARRIAVEIDEVT
jgi:hypothetical protein